MKPLEGEIKKAETILKGHRIDLKRRSEIAEQVRRLKKQKSPLRDKNAIVSLNTIYKKSRRLDLDLKRTKAQAKKPAPKVPEKYQLLFVVRNYRGVESDTSRDMLKELGLLRPNTGRLMSNCASNLEALGQIFPFVFYGTPSLKTVKSLLHKRGTVFQANQTQLISSNVVVEDHFSNFGIFSLSELIDNIFHGHNHCEDVLSKLGPIVLSTLNEYSRHFDDKCKYGMVNIDEVLIDK